MRYELKKHWYKWPTIIIGCLSAWALTAHYVLADGIVDAAIYANDRLICNLYVDQNWINESLVRGSIERNITIQQAYELAVERGSVLNTAIKENGRVSEYCWRRQEK